MILGMTKKSTTKASVKTVATKAKGKVSARAGKTPSPAAPAEIDKVGKAQMVDLMSESDRLSRKDAAEVIDVVLGVVIGALQAGKSVGLPGLGTLKVKATAARQGVKPGTAERIEIPAGKKVSYKVASTLKTAL